jgi:hypothetical protein
MGPPAKRRNPKAPTLRAEKWQPYKDIIIRLHIVERQPLNRVMRIMETEHGFKARYVSVYEWLPKAVDNSPK